MTPKFKVWDKKSKRFVPPIDLHCAFILMDEIVTIEYFNHIEKYSTSTLQKYEFEIVLSTGLHDKHEKEIYVGDVIKYCESSKFYQVVWDDFYSCWNLKGFHAEYSDIPDQAFSQGMKDNIEIIGNIQENPELLEEKE